MGDTQPTSSPAGGATPESLRPAGSPLFKSKPRRAGVASPVSSPLPAATSAVESSSSSSTTTTTTTTTITAAAGAAESTDPPTAPVAPVAPVAPKAAPRSGSSPKKKSPPETKSPKYQPMDMAKYPELLCEGHLTKVKSNSLKNKSRHFRLTTQRLAYYEENAGLLISGAPRDSIESVEDCGKSRFKIKFNTAVGRDKQKGNQELLLEADSPGVKNKWLTCLTMDLGNRPPDYREELVAEGYLTKMQPMCTTNTTRWFRVTKSKFSYYKEECGEKYADVSLENIDLITHTEDKREFKVCSAVPMTRTKFYDVTCRCATQAERDKWVALLQRVVPQHKLSSTLQMCCYMDV